MKKEKQIWDRLVNLDETKSNIFYVNNFESVSIEPDDNIDAWLDAQLMSGLDEELVDWEKLEKSFLSIGRTGEGGEYYLWDYEGREGEAPVVYLGGSGEYDLLAASLGDFICMLSHGKVFSSLDGEEYKDVPIWNDIDNFALDDIIESNNLKSREEAKMLYLNECKDFFKLFDGLIDFKSMNECLVNMEKSKSFKDWVDVFLCEKAIESGFLTFEAIEDEICRVVPQDKISQKYLDMME